MDVGRALLSLGTPRNPQDVRALTPLSTMTPLKAGSPAAGFIGLNHRGESSHPAHKEEGTQSLLLLSVHLLPLKSQVCLLAFTAPRRT